MPQIKLGSTTYDLQALNMKSSKVWRKQFGELLEPLIKALSQEMTAETGVGETLQLLAAVRDTIIQAPDLCADALFAYAVNLRDLRETIEEEATDQEAMDAFVEVLKLAYPFTALLKMVRSGQKPPGMSKK